MLKSDAYRSLNVYARCLYIELKRLYNGTNNGNIPLSHRDAQPLVGCSDGPIKKAFLELQDRGFIKVSQKGSFNWKTRIDPTEFSRATTWILTEYPVDYPTKVLSGPTKEYMRWKPKV
ncbi:hypothetical protein D3C80_1836780 [compost metagenome]